jgi:hypothetical protein
MCTCIIYCLHVAGYDVFRPTLAIFRYITGIPSVIKLQWIRCVGVTVELWLINVFSLHSLTTTP